MGSRRDPRTIRHLTSHHSVRSSGPTDGRRRTLPGRSNDDCLRGTLRLFAFPGERTYWLQLDAPGLFTAVRAAAAPQETLETVVAQTQALLAGALDRARRAHAVRDDVTLADVLLAIAMFDGVISVQSQVPGDEPVERALTIVLRGLRSAARSELPVPRPALRLPTP